MSDAAARLVRLYLQQSPPLRRAAVANKLGTLSKNLGRAAKAASELGEQGMTQVVLASGCNNPLEPAEPIRMIANLQDLALWSTRAAETAKLMSLSAEDHKGGRTPDVRLRSLMTILINQYEYLLGVKASHVVDPATGRGRSTFDLFVKEAIRIYAPEGTHFEPRRIDDAIRWDLPSRAIRTGRCPPRVPTLCANSCAYWRNRQRGRSWRRKGVDTLLHTAARRTTDAARGPCFRSSLFVGSRGGDPHQRGAADGQALELHWHSAHHPPAQNLSENSPIDGAVHEEFACSVKVVAGVGFEPTTFRL